MTLLRKICPGPSARNGFVIGDPGCWPGLSDGASLALGMRQAGSFLDKFVSHMRHELVTPWFREQKGLGCFGSGKLEACGTFF
jgi:hypothetical protein